MKPDKIRSDNNEGRLIEVAQYLVVLKSCQLKLTSQVKRIFNKKALIRGLKKVTQIFKELATTLLMNKVLTWYLV